MLKKFFFYSGVVIGVCGILLAVIGYARTSNDWRWEPGFTGFLLILHAPILIFISRCMRLNGFLKGAAILSGVLIFAGLGLHCSDQVTRFFFDIRLMDWQVRDAYVLAGTQIALALLVGPAIVMFTQKLKT